MRRLNQAIRQGTDSRHWSQRWLRVARVGADSIVLFDLSRPIEIEGCGEGRCKPLSWTASPDGPRYRVSRFWDMELCPNCGRAFGFARADETLYLGDNLEEAQRAYAAAEGDLLKAA